MCANKSFRLKQFDMIAYMHRYIRKLHSFAYWQCVHIVGCIEIDINQNVMCSMSLAHICTAHIEPIENVTRKIVCNQLKVIGFKMNSAHDFQSIQDLFKVQQTIPVKAYNFTLNLQSKWIYGFGFVGTASNLLGELNAYYMRLTIWVLVRAHSIPCWKVWTMFVISQ